MKIDSIAKYGNTINIKVINLGGTDAVNIRIEACCLQNSNKTYHFEIDREDFLILPKRNKDVNICSRIFKINDISNRTKKYTDYPTVLNMLEKNNFIFRVRVHAYHSLSGFGKAFEQHFKWAENKFIEINN